MPATARPAPAPVQEMLRNGLSGARRIVFGETESARTQRDALVAFTVRSASAAVLYLSQIALARWMGAFEYGVYVLVWTLVLIFGALSHLGFATLVMRMVAVLAAKGDHGALAGLLITSRRVALGVGTAIACVAAGLLWLAGDRIGEPYVLPVYLALVCVPMFALADVQDGVGRGSARIVLGLVPPYVLRPLLVLAVMALALFFGLPMTAVTAAGAAVLATWTATLVQLFLVRRTFAPVTRGAVPDLAVRRWLALSLPMLVVMMAEVALQNIDVLVVSRWLAPPQVALYYAAAKTMSLVLFIHYAVGSAVANRFAAIGATGDRARLAEVVRDAARWTFWPSLAVTIVLLACGKPLLSLFGPGFADAWPVMAVLALGYLARAACGPVDYLLNMLGEQRRCALVVGVAAALDLALAMVLVPRFGLLGAASATAIAFAGASLAMAALADRRLGVAVGVWSTWRQRPVA
jgi:O-antigen/teichoic acid export membrane protein